MSEQESDPVSSDGGQSVIVVDQAASRQKVFCQEDSPELVHKRSRAPAVPSVAEELKYEVEELPKDTEVVSSEQIKHNAAQDLSSSINRQKEQLDAKAILLTNIDSRQRISPQKQPIPPDVSSVSSGVETLDAEKAAQRRAQDTDSITEETVQARTEKDSKRHTEWFDDEEASGLPRSESRASRASRVSRAVRQLFCCGVRLQAPSEDNVSYERDCDAI